MNRIETSNNTKGAQEPEDYYNNHYHIQDFFDIGLHRDVTVNQPENHPNNNQNYH
jgi:hypothetical protein